MPLSVRRGIHPGFPLNVGALALRFPVLLFISPVALPGGRSDGNRLPGSCPPSSCKLQFNFPCVISQRKASSLLSSTCPSAFLVTWHAVTFPSTSRNHPCQCASSCSASSTVSSPLCRETCNMRKRCSRSFVYTRVLSHQRLISSRLESFEKLLHHSHPYGLGSLLKYIPV